MKNQLIIIFSVVFLVVVSILFLGAVEYNQKTGKESQGWWNVYFLAPYEKESLDFAIENYDEKAKEFTYEIVSEEKILESEKVLVNFNENKVVNSKIKNTGEKPVEVRVYLSDKKSDSKSLNRK